MLLPCVCVSRLKLNVGGIRDGYVFRNLVTYSYLLDLLVLIGVGTLCTVRRYRLNSKPQSSVFTILRNHWPLGNLYGSIF
jgi:hypothetical protein